jgi:hypothetical protein
MTVTTNEYGVVKLEADEGKAICRVDESGPTTVTTLYLAKTESAADYKDCAYGVPVPPRTFSKLKLYAALAAANLWDALKTWLEAQTYEGMNAWTAFSLAQELTEDHPMFAAWFSAAKTALGVDDATAEALLDAAAT